MATISDKSDFIRNEFECFVRIGLDTSLRFRVQKTIEQLLLSGGAAALPPAIYLEARDGSGELREIWYVEPDTNQVLRLLEFLRRFSVDQVRMISIMLRQEL